MDNQELIDSLRYLIIKYIPKKDRNNILEYLKKDEIPVKGILSDIHKVKNKEIESTDGNLIKKIYYYYCWWFFSTKHTNFTTRKFVALSSDMERIIAEYNAAGNDPNILSKRLALGERDLSSSQIYIIRIKPSNPRFTYKMPTGKEIEAYAWEWTPGGMTKGGIKEAEVIKTDGTVETILKQFDDYERLQ